MAKTSGLHVFVSVTALHADLTWSFAIRGFVHQNNVESVTTVARGMCVCVKSKISSLGFWQKKETTTKNPSITPVA